MDFISIQKLEEKLKAGESIEEIAKDYSVSFSSGGKCVPDYIPVETLFKIIEKVPELFLTGKDIPAWLFLLLLVREKFDIVDTIIEGLFNKRNSILKSSIKEKSSDTACKTIETIKQITTEQISTLLSLIDKRRKDLFSHQSEDDIVKFLVDNFFEPGKDFLSKEHFVVFLEWATKETTLHFFKHVPYPLLDKIPMDNQLVQKKLIDYFLSAYPSELFNNFYSNNKIFKRPEKIKLFNEKLFIPSVTETYTKLQNPKRVYLLNFPYFLENYPQLVIKSLKEFIKNPGKCSNFIVGDKKIFIPNDIWDILIKKDSLLLLNLIRNLPSKRFYFDIDYVSDKAKLACFVNPENPKELNDRLELLKGMFKEKAAYKIIREIKQEASIIRTLKPPQHALDALNFIFDRLPYDVVCWISRIMIPPGPPFANFDEEELEYKFRSIKPQLQEALTYLRELNKKTKKSKS